MQKGLQNDRSDSYIQIPQVSIVCLVFSVFPAILWTRFSPRFFSFFFNMTLSSAFKQKILFICVASFLFLALVEGYANNVLVNTRDGPVDGFSITSHYSAYNKKRINVFLGIPYAKRPSQFNDPKREFRFKKPERPSWSSIWDASYYRPACPQPIWYIRETVPNFSAANISEDCLYLNIFVPNRTDDLNSNSPSLHPVMVFFHGGGFTMGSAQQYPGVFLAERDIMVVTVNYRLGALGFLSTGDLNSPGNYGMWDQLRALEWIWENIQNFRGNPNIITIFGQSTGAASVGLHLLSPRSNNLFHRAIMQSGSDRSEWAVITKQSHAKDYARELAREIGCPTGDMFRLVQCLQVYRTDMEIVNASTKIRLKSGSVGNPWGPVVDGPVVGVDYAFLPDSPRTMREQARFKKIVVMGGLNKDDGSFFIPNLPTLGDGISSTQFTNILYEFLRDRGTEDMVNTNDALKFQYTWWPQPKNITMTRQMVSDMMSDYMFGTGIDESMNYQTQYNKTFFYVFNYFSWNDYLPYYRGIAHGQELQYVFGYPYINQTYMNIFGVYPRQRYDYADRNMSEYMISLWTNFSAFGDPTPRIFDLKYFKNVTWREHNLFNHSYFHISNSSSNVTNYRQQYYGFWRSYFPQIFSRPITTGQVTLPPTNQSEYQMATWSLTALGALLIIIIIALCIKMYRSRPKDY